MTPLCSFRNLVAPIVMLPLVPVVTIPHCSYQHSFSPPHCPVTLLSLGVLSTGLPPGSGLSRRSDGLVLYAAVGDKLARLGTSHAGDFPDSPEDGWATALAYREHVLRVVQRLREDPEAAVEVAEVDGKGRRLRAWAPEDESVRPKVLVAVRAALGPAHIKGRRARFYLVECQAVGATEPPEPHLQFPLQANRCKVPYTRTIPLRSP